jgi:MerR family regulatory protein
MLRIAEDQTRIFAAESMHVRVRQNLKGLISFGKVLGRMDDSISTLGDYLTVGKAAAALGVSRSTLRNWDKAGKLTPCRHPINGYRLYNRHELEILLQEVQTAQWPNT